MIKGIWVQQPLSKPEKEVESFYKLKSIEVGYCHQLEYVLPSYMLPQLHNLLKLDITECKELEVIVSNKLKEKEATNNDILVFPQLKTLTLSGLDNLKCFCTGTDQLLFSHKVILPVLEELKVEALNSIEEIWDKQSPSVNQETESFGQLRNIEVKGCKKLINLVPSNILPRLRNLQFLEVDDCPNVEIIVFKSKKGKKEAADDSTLIIPQLRDLRIWKMENLKSFYSSSTTSNAQSLFNHQVAFPVLEDIKIWAVPMITDIWPQQPLSEPEKEVESFCKLKSITVGYCDQLEYVLPSYMLPQLHNLLHLEISFFKELEVIVSNKLKETQATNNNILVFPQLKTLSLESLDNLKCFCTGGKQLLFPQLKTLILCELDNLRCFCTGTDQLLFSHKVAFPALKHLEIGFMPNITKIWDNKALPEPKQEIESFSKLAKIGICACEQLVYVLPSHMLPRLQNLRRLAIGDCEEVEVIVSEELKEKEAADNDPIVFSQLKVVEFSNLPKLKSFYTGTQFFFSNKDAFPVLENIRLPKGLGFLRNGTSTEEECSSSGEEIDYSEDTDYSDEEG